MLKFAQQLAELTMATFPLQVEAVPVELGQSLPVAIPGQAKPDSGEDWRVIQAQPCRYDVNKPGGFLAECQLRGITLSLTPNNQLVICSDGRSNQALHDAMDDAALMAEVKQLLRKLQAALPKTK